MALLYCDHGRSTIPAYRYKNGEPLLDFCPVCVALSDEHEAPFVRVEAMEDIGKDRTDPRTRGINLGLPGVVEDGKYRPAYSDEFNSAHKAREWAKRNGLTMLDVHYRSRR